MLIGLNKLHKTDGWETILKIIYPNTKINTPLNILIKTD